MAGRYAPRGSAQFDEQRQRRFQIEDVEGLGDYRRLGEAWLNAGNAVRGAEQEGHRARGERVGHGPYHFPAEVAVEDGRAGQRRAGVQECARRGDAAHRSDNLAAKILQHVTYREGDEDFVFDDEDAGGGGAQSLIGQGAWLRRVVHRTP